MKKIMFSMIAFAAALFSSVATSHAQSFNTDPRDLATVLVARGSATAGSVNGQWQSSVSAVPGDTIGVQLYYHNTGSTTANNVAVGIGPRVSAQSTTHIMKGGILVNGYVVKTGSATVQLSQPATLTFIDAQWFPNQSTTGQSIDGNALFANYGFSVGSLPPGWSAQGTVVARYRVGDAVNPPQTNCTVDSFNASPTIVGSGGYTTLSWSTTGCDYVTIDGENFPANGSISRGPLYSGKSYELRGVKNGNVTSARTVFVSVNQINNQQCSVTSFYALPTTINSGTSTTLYWNTFGCDYVTIDGENFPANGSTMTRAIFSSRSFDLRGFLNNNPTSARTAFVNVNSVVNPPIFNNTQPQAITTVATITSNTSARLNGIAIPNFTGTSTVWFEWGTSGNLGSRTSTQTVSGSGSNYFSDVVNNLVPGTMYYYRAVVQNVNGLAYGDIVRFQTQTTVINPPTRVITREVREPVREVVVAQSAPSLLELRVENVYDRMCVGGEMEYTVTYRNISSQTLRDAVLRVTHPQELTFLSGSRGDYEPVDRVLTIALGDLTAGESGSVVIRARVNNQAIRGNVAVLTAQVVYTNTVTRAQEDAIAYSLITISDECPSNNFGASAFGLGFLPNTLLGWLILILVILACLS